MDRGARWVPDRDDSYELRRIRDVLLALGKDHAGELMQILADHGADLADIKKLMKTPRMKELASAIAKARVSLRHHD